MKITKRQLRRIIKEEKAKLLYERHPSVQEGIWRGTHQGVWGWLEAEFDQEMTGEDVWINPEYTESIAAALEAIANEIRDHSAGRNPGGSIG